LRRRRRRRRDGRKGNYIVLHHEEENGEYEVFLTVNYSDKTLTSYFVVFQEVIGLDLTQNANIFATAVYYNSTKCMEELLRAFPSGITMKINQNQKYPALLRAGAPGKNEVPAIAQPEREMNVYEFTWINGAVRCQILGKLNILVVARYWKKFRLFNAMEKQKKIPQDLAHKLQDELIKQIVADGTPLNPDEKISAVAYDVSSEY
jgi:hypothetical protein